MDGAGMDTSTRTHRIVMTVLAVLVFLGGATDAPDPAGSAQSPEAVEAAKVLASQTEEAQVADGEPRIQVVQSDPASDEVVALRTSLLDWALSRFDDAGLELPPVDVRFLDVDKCDGYVGTLSQGETRFVVRSCATGGQLRQNLLHELAHAWDLAGSIADKTKDRFLELRGLVAWHAADTDWNEKGSEHAAEIIAWGLEAAEWAINSPIAEVGPQDTDSLREAFVLLTGRTPLWETVEG